MVNGVVTFCFEGDEDEVQEITEKILTAVDAAHPDIYERLSISEDTWEEEKLCVTKHHRQY